MKMTSELFKQWLDHRIKVHEMQCKHLTLQWGTLGDDGFRDCEVQECGILTDKVIHLYLSVYTKKSREEVFKEIVELAGVTDTVCDGWKLGNGIYNTDTHKSFMYKGYQFHMDLSYDEDAIDYRTQRGLEV